MPAGSRPAPGEFGGSLMEGQEGFAFEATSTVLALALIVSAGAGFLCWTAWRRSGFHRGTGWLEALRWVLLTLVMATLCQPEWVGIRSSARVAPLVVLWDRSASMEISDVLEGLPSGSTPVSRAEAIEPLAAETAWAAAENDRAVVIESFSSRLDVPEEGTDLDDALDRVLEKYAHLRGLVLLTDGAWNVGDSPAQAATRLKTRAVPVFAVGVGSPTPLPDLALERLVAPTFAVVGKPLRIPFEVRSSLGQDRELTAVLSVAGQGVANQSVLVPAMGTAQSGVSWTPAEVGDFSLTLEIDRDPADRVADNNAITVPVAVRKEELKVLLIESYPRWEYRYLRNALERDPGVQVTCLLFHPDLPAMGGGRSYIDKFPDSAALNGFDVVFLGDVGLGEDGLSREQALNLKRLISSQASGMVFLPGRLGRQRSLAAGPLAELYPVVDDPASPRGRGSRQQAQIRLTSLGESSLLTRLAETDRENAEIWRKLPGFYWHAGVQRAKRGGEVLGVHENATTSFGRVPLIVTGTYGAGKTLFMGVDSAWRWREGVEDRYHYRFWGQVARWMAYQRQKAQGRSMRLFASPDHPRVNERITLHANVLDALGDLLEAGKVTVDIAVPSGRTETVRLRPGRSGERGLFAGSFVPQESGNYVLTAESEGTGASVETTLSVQGYDRERQERLARFDVLEELVEIAGGEMVPLAAAGELPERLVALPEPESALHRLRIWAHPGWCAFLIFLMGVFWAGRKLNGTV